MDKEIKQYIDRGLHIFTEQLRKHESESVELRIKFFKELTNTVERTIKVVVNGKIDQMSADLKEHMMRVEPAISAFEEDQVYQKKQEKKENNITRKLGMIISIGSVAGGVLFILKKFL